MPLYSICSISALIGAKPVPEASSTSGCAMVLAQEEAAERPFDAQDVARLQRAEDMVGEFAAGHVAQVQFDPRLLVADHLALAVRRVGDRVAAPVAVAQDELDILAGLVHGSDRWPATASSASRHRGLGRSMRRRGSAACAPEIRRGRARCAPRSPGRSAPPRGRSASGRRPPRPRSAPCSDACRG